MVVAKEPVQQEKVNGEVNVNGPALLVMVPVKKFGRHEEAADAFQVPGDIGVYEGGVGIEYEKIGLGGGGPESRGEHRNDRHGSQDKDFERVHVRTSNPVYGSRRLMHLMKSPEGGYAMKCAVHSVFYKIHDEQHNLHQLKNEGLCADAFPHSPEGSLS